MGLEFSSLGGYGVKDPIARAAVEELKGKTASDIQTLQQNMSNAINVVQQKHDADMAAIQQDVYDLETQLEGVDSAVLGRITALEEDTATHTERIEILEAASEQHDSDLAALEAKHDSDIHDLEIRVKYPKLTAEQKTQITTLAAAYRTNNSKFMFYDNLIRNNYADGSCFDAETGKAKMNCGLYVQMVWGGIAPETFADKMGSYEGEIIKSFDWGYYFNFPNRMAYGKTRADGSLYGFVKPNEDNFEGSYSYNSYYSKSATDNEYHQIFNNFMNVNDMASELWYRGCEIPLAELEAGDIVFFESPSINDGKYDEFHTQAFRHITHAAIVTSATNVKLGRMQILDCSDWVTGSPFSYCAINTGHAGDAARMASFHNRIVMCARHPIAFNQNSAVPDVFEAI